MSGRCATATGVRWTTDAVSVVASVVCAVALWVLATQVSGLELEVRRGDEPASVGMVAVIVTATVCSALGLGALRLLERRSRRALTTWTGLVVVTTLVSLAGPLAATSATARGTLIGLHLLVAVVVTLGAHRSRRLNARAPSAFTSRG